jgi:hypothetical protein
VGERLPHAVGVTGRDAAARGAEPLWGGRQADGRPLADRAAVLGLLRAEPLLVPRGSPSPLVLGPKAAIMGICLERRYHPSWRAARPFPGTTPIGKTPSLRGQEPRSRKEP